MSWFRQLRVSQHPVALVILVVATIAFAGSPAANANASTFPDAELLALEISGELLPPVELAARVADDLAAIRQHDARFDAFHVFPDWVPGMLLVELTPEAWESHLAGQYDGWDELNEQYGLSISPDTYPGTRIVRLTFHQYYNPQLLAALYHGTAGIEDAYPLLQTDGAYDIYAEVPAPGAYTGTYTFQESWAVCTPEGCYFRHHAWVLAVSAAGVVLVEEHGSPLAVETGTWGGVKNLFRGRE
jgi:hypothetical protein